VKRSVFHPRREKVYIAMSYNYEQTDFCGVFASVERAHERWPDPGWTAPDRWGERYSPRWEITLLEEDVS
jgi:hypothetical protein